MKTSITIDFPSITVILKLHSM